MSKAVYVGVSNKAREVPKLYVGVDGKARKVKKGYIGVNGVARLFYAPTPAIDKPVLPNGYIATEYIYSNKAASITLDYKVIPSTQIQAKMYVPITEYNGKTHVFIFSGRYPYTNIAYRYLFERMCFYRKNDGGLCVQIGREMLDKEPDIIGNYNTPSIPESIDKASYVQVAYNLSSPFDLIMNGDGTCSVNGVQYSTESSLVEYAGDTVSFVAGFSEIITCRYYSIKIYEDNILRYDLVPCRTLAGTIGMYDLANKIMHVSDSSYPFMAGPDL